MAMRWVRRRLKVAGSHLVTSTGPLASSIRTSPRVALLRRLMQRSKVDLPEPESPISTQISPGWIATVASATPITWPVSSRIALRSAP
jgi:hypothetical protein